MCLRVCVCVCVYILHTHTHTVCVKRMHFFWHHSPSIDSNVVLSSPWFMGRAATIRLQCWPWESQWSRCQSWRHVSELLSGEALGSVKGLGLKRNLSYKHCNSNTKSNNWQLRWGCTYSVTNATALLLTYSPNQWFTIIFTVISHQSSCLYSRSPWFTHSFAHSG